MPDTDTKPESKSETKDNPDPSSKHKTICEHVIERAEKDPNLSYGERTILHAVGSVGSDLIHRFNILTAVIARANNGFSNAQAGGKDAPGQMAFPFPGNPRNESTV